MLHVMIDEVRHGEETLSERIDEVWIANVTGAGDFADYQVWTSDPRNPGRLPDEPWPPSDAWVIGHYRPQGARELVRAALAALGKAGH